MLISKDWLETYFDQKLPEGDRLAEVFNFHSFEVEEIKSWDTDEILDIKVLADRACYALCHRGIAKELSASANIKLKEQKVDLPKENIKSKPDIDVVDNKLCFRYVGRRVENVKVAESPSWLKARLESIGERSINNIVDVANFVMFDIGQPLHAFDADKIVGTIKIRKAKKGEKITTLDHREIELGPEILIIADEEGPLAIAGVKGGNRAEVTFDTKNLVLESANFYSSSIRLTSTGLNLKTGASRRFEANLSPELAGEAMDAFSSLISTLCKDAKFGPKNDIYNKKQNPVKIIIETDFIRNVLGIKIEDQDILSILSKLEIEVKGKNGVLSITPPFSRMDLRIPEDVVEEVGRIYGYEKLSSDLPPKLRGRAMVNKNFYYSEKIKNILVENGFSEVSLYSLKGRGFLEVAHPLASDKKFLRENLADGLSECLKQNALNAPILGLSEIRIFEVGSVFSKNGERVHLCVGRQFVGKKERSNDDIIREINNLLNSTLGMVLSTKITSGPTGAVAEFDITDVFTTHRSPNSYDDLSFELSKTYRKFLPFSTYPFVLRDIAVFTPKGTTEEDVLNIIKEESGELLKRTDLFDVFTKKMSNGEEKTSYAFHLVFQSMEKTLNDVEVNEIMDRVTKRMNAREGWQVR